MTSYKIEKILMSIHKILQIYYKKSIRKMDNKFKQKMYKKLNANVK